MKDSFPSRDQSVLRYLLQHRADACTDQSYAIFEDGEVWSYGHTWYEARRAAALLAEMGLKYGDVLLLWVPNGPDFLRLWMGANLLGAVVAAPNLAYQGSILAHVIALADPRIVAVHVSLAERLKDISWTAIATVLEVGGASGASYPVNHQVLNWQSIDPIPVTDLPELNAWDTQLIVFTSGTTGLSKGVIVPYAQLCAAALTHFADRFGVEDRYLLNLPLFHISGLLIATGALMTGGAIVVLPRFKTDEFWGVVRRWNVTGATLIGAAATFLENQEQTSNEADNSLRCVSMFPLVKEYRAFCKRFGITVFTAYGMSELSIPITTDTQPGRYDSCGRLRAAYEARLVDEHDLEVSDGEPGELVLRTSCPWIISPGYWRDAKATADVWRNGWFHTGDTFRRSPDGEFFFVDRIKDAVRRRGENISSYEVEVELAAHPEVNEAAVIGVPSKMGEQDVLAVIVRSSNSTLSEPELLKFVSLRLPRFMRPRYIRFVDALPRTPSLRVQKYLLRAEGITADCWDAELSQI